MPVYPHICFLCVGGGYVRSPARTSSSGRERGTRKCAETWDAKAPRSQRPRFIACRLVRSALCTKPPAFHVQTNTHARCLRLLYEFPPRIKEYTADAVLLVCALRAYFLYTSRARKRRWGGGYCLLMFIASTTISLPADGLQTSRMKSETWPRAT